MVGGVLGRVYGQEISPIEEGDLHLKGTPISAGIQSDLGHYQVGPSTALYLRPSIVDLFQLELAFFFNREDQRKWNPSYTHYWEACRSLKNIANYDPYKFYGTVWVRDQLGKSSYEFSQAQLTATGKVMPLQDSDMYVAPVVFLLGQIQMTSDNDFKPDSNLELEPEPKAGTPPNTKVEETRDLRFVDILEDL